MVFNCIPCLVEASDLLQHCAGQARDGGGSIGQALAVKSEGEKSLSVLAPSSDAPLFLVASCS